MSAGFRLIAPITIRMDGTIVVDGDTYWCEELSARIGETVAVRTGPNTRMWVQVLSQCGDEFLCCADMIKDGEQEAADRRLRAARHASIIGCRAHIGAQEAQGGPKRRAAEFATVTKGLRSSGLQSVGQLVLRALNDAWVRLRDGVKQGQNDEAQGADFDVGLVQASPVQRDAVFEGHRHSQAPFKSSAKQPATGGGAGHRLSEDSE